MPWSPAVTVAAVICAQDRYLMVEERPDGITVLNQPAGHLEFGETLVEAVQREVMEETGHRFIPTGLVGVYQWTLPDTDRTFLRFCFHGNVAERDATYPIDPAISAVRWMSYRQIVSGRLALRSPMVQRCLDDARTRPPLGLEALHALA